MKAIGKFIMYAMLANSVVHANTLSTEEVWEKHIKAWNSRDVEQILEDYSPTSSIIVNNKIYRGAVEIGGLFEQLFSIFDQAKEHVIDTPTISDEVVYITWSARINTHAYPLGTDTFVIRSGKIQYQTIATNANLLKEGAKLD